MMGLSLCLHRNMSFPRSLGYLKGEYVVCLDCGRQWQYLWRTMRQGNEIRVQPETDVSKNLLTRPAQSAYSGGDS
jgi:hypothetical protein